MSVLRSSLGATLVVLAALQLAGCASQQGSAPVVDLLSGSLGWLARLSLRLSMDHLFAQKALGRLRSHLIEAEGHTGWRWGGVETDDGPLFSANLGSTRSPIRIDRIGACSRS